MELKVKAANRAEFNQAGTGKEVYGTVPELRGKKGALFVYIELGIQQLYNDKDRDDPNAEFLRFSGCRVELFESEEACDRDEILDTLNNVEVILYF